MCEVGVGNQVIWDCTDTLLSKSKAEMQDLSARCEEGLLFARLWRLLLGFIR